METIVTDTEVISTIVPVNTDSINDTKQPKYKGRVHYFRVVKYSDIFWVHNRNTGVLNHDKRTAIQDLKKIVCKEGDTYELINVPFFNKPHNQNNTPKESTTKN